MADRYSQPMLTKESRASHDTGPARHAPYDPIGTASLALAISALAAFLLGAVVGAAMNFSSIREISDLRTIFGWLGVGAGTVLAISALVLSLIAVSKTSLISSGGRRRALWGLIISGANLVLWPALFSGIVWLILYPDHFLPR